jgi:signal transduction histidine kinase
MMQPADTAAYDSELKLLRYLSAEISDGSSSVAEVLESVCDKLLYFLDISRAGAFLLPATGEPVPFCPKRRKPPLPIYVDNVFKALDRTRAVPRLISMEVDGIRLDTLVIFLAFRGHQSFVLILQNEARLNAPSHLADPKIYNLCSILHSQLSQLLTHRIELNSRRIESELFRDLLEKEQLFADDAWHTIAAAIPRFLPDWEPAKLEPAPRVQFFTFDPDMRTLSLRGKGDANSGLVPIIFEIENTIPGMLVTKNLQEERIDYLLIDPHLTQHLHGSHLFDQTSSSELLITVRHHGKILGIIDLQHPLKGIFSPLHISILLEAAEFIAPFAHTIQSEGRRRLKREIGLLYVQGKIVDRLTSTYLHKISQSIPLIDFSLRDLSDSLGSYDGADKKLQEVSRLISRLFDNAKDFLSYLPRATSFQPTDVVDAARHAISEMAPVQSTPIEFTFRADPEQQMVLASGLLPEHIYNLLRNALDSVDLALRKGHIVRGRVSVSVARLQRVDKRGISIVPGRIALRISDNGIGIPTDFETQIFEYGFTTKGSRGSGYGLPAARDYARSLGGDLLLESGTDGATFVMILQEYTPRYHDQLLQRLVLPRQERRV